MVSMHVTCVCEWYSHCWSSKRILMGSAWLLRSCNWASKSVLMEEMLLPESRRTSWVVCWTRAIVVQLGEVDDVEAWMCWGGSPYDTPHITFLTT